MAHGRRRGIIPGGCHVTGKTQFTCYDRAQAALARVKDAIRSYRCSGCGWYHITKLSEDEYAQQIADRIAAELKGCTPSPFGGTMDITDDEENSDEDDQAPTQGGGSGSAEPGSHAGGPGEAPLACGGQPRLSPSPATLAQRLQARSA